MALKQIINNDPFAKAKGEYKFGYFSDVCYSWVDVSKHDYAKKNDEGEIYERGSGSVIRPRYREWYRKDKKQTFLPEPPSDTA